MTTALTSATDSADASRRRRTAAVPPLENGDHLTRIEFEARYARMPEQCKAELVDGVVHMQAAVRAEFHGDPHFDLITWLGTYASATPGVIGSDNSTLRIDLDNEVQPDATLRQDQEHGGQCVVDQDGYLTGVPELVAEVAASSASYDLHSKLRVYRRSGVLEYLVWRVLDEAFDWFVLEDGEFVRQSPDEDGILRSEVFAGLWLNVSALLQRDMPAVQKTLQLGMTSTQTGGTTSPDASESGSSDNSSASSPP